MTARRHPRGEASLGASLVGLLLIVVLLGALAAIVVVAGRSGDSTGTAPSGDGPVGVTRPAGSAAARAACTTSAATIEEAALAYYAGHEGTWPPDLASLTEGPTPLLRSPPDPSWGLVYDNSTGNVDASGCDRL